MLIKFLKSGVLPFFAGVIIIVAYSLISPWKIGADTSPYPMSVFNIVFTVLFLLSCCIAAFQYGKRQNKSGLCGLICIWLLFYVSLIFAAMPSISGVTFFIAIIMFSYWTLFIIADLLVFFGAPAVMIIIISWLWFAGRKHSQRL